jgi:hypothetical protein
MKIIIIDSSMEKEKWVDNIDETVRDWRLRYTISKYKQNVCIDLL